MLTLTRRDFIAALGSSLMALNVPSAARTASPLQRPIPRDGSLLPVIGLGTWQAFDIEAGDTAASADGLQASASGYGSSAGGDFTTATGSFSNAGGYGASALGYGAEAGGDYATAVGVVATASGVSSVAVGEFSEATGDESVAVGGTTFFGFIPWSIHNEAAACRNLCAVYFATSASSSLVTPAASRIGFTWFLAMTPCESTFPLKLGNTRSSGCDGQATFHRRRAATNPFGMGMRR